MQFILELIEKNLINAVVLTLFVNALAYLHSPRAKSLLFATPVPFTCGFLASGAHVNTTHVSALILVTLYHWFVLLLHRHWRVPLLVSIPIGALTYVAAGAICKPLVSVPFLAMLAIAGGFWCLGVKLYKPIVEPGHRSPTPVWIKAPVIFVIAMCIYSLTGLMAGAVSFFPFAGVFTSWEMRKSLRTLAGQYTINNIGGVGMLLAMWLVQDHTNALGSLAAGWIMMLGALGAIYWFELGKPQEQAMVAAHADMTELADK